MSRYRWWQWTLSSLLSALVALWVRPVQAGGWATVTAEVWPAPFVAGEPYTIPLVVRQHGVRPVTVEGNVQVVLSSPLDGEAHTVTAKATEVVGRYLLEVTFAAPGQWMVEVQPGWFPPAVFSAHVVAPERSDARAAAGGWWWSVIPLALAAGYLTRRARRGVLWQIAVAVLVGGSVLALLGWGQAQKVTTAPAPAEVGQLLFGAKGCVTCHRHAAVAATWSTEMGPNLSEYGADPAWLARWLADPESVRPQTQMPNLNLSPDEIASLSAFLLAN